MAKTPALSDIWLFCAMVENLRELPTATWTYKKLAHRIEHDTDEAARQRFWPAKATAVNLRRCVERLTDHYGRELLSEDGINELTLQPFGAEVYGVFQPVVAPMVALHNGREPGARLRVCVDETLACEVVPGCLSVYRQRTQEHVPFSFPRLDYRTLRDEVSRRRTEFGLGWEVRRTDWGDVEVHALSEGVPFGFVASRREASLHQRPAEAFREAICRKLPLFLSRTEHNLAGLEAALAGLDDSLIVEVASFQAALTHARCGDGIGLVPLLPWVLEPRSRTEKVVCAPVPGVEQRIVCYLPPGGQQELDGRAAQLLEALREHIAARFRESQPRTGQTATQPYGPPHTGGPQRVSRP